MIMAKYNNVKCTYSGIKFDSIGERNRYRELEMMQNQCGQIIELKTQVKFPIIVNDVKICTYIADFTYKRKEDMQYIVEDFKGVQTSIFKLKKKLMKAVYGIDILLTFKKK